MEKRDNKGLLILDSKHILATSKSIYDVKLVQCGDFTQLYFYKNRKVISKKDDDFDLNLKKSKVCSMVTNDIKNEKEIKLKTSDEIELRSIIRSKLECQRIAKANMKSWKTFITLTFAENITDVCCANKRFKYFIDKVRRIKKDFMYLCITEFQKRGAVHFHLLCNIDIDDTTLIYNQKDNQKFKHIKYWNDGFSSVEILNGDTKKVVGYISKYMTKDIDNRLFNKHRYLFSRNLVKPTVNYIDLEDKKQMEYYKKIIQDKELIYHNEYINPYDRNEVTFLEFSTIHR